MRRASQFIGLSALIVACVVASCLPRTALAQDPKPRDQDIHLELYEGDPPGEPTLPEGAPAPETRYDKYGVYRCVREPAIDVYMAKGKSRTRAAVIICPGGSYSGLVYQREGIQTAKWFRERGVNAVVLRYRFKPYRFPVPMTDVQRAVQVVRAHAEQWDIDPNRIGLMGFSAGGHDASLATVYHIDADPKSKDPVARFSSRPDFAVLVYPVITMADPDTHAGSRKNLLGPNPSEELIDEASSYKHVNKQTPPTLLVYAKDDNVVPIRNSELFLEALKKNGIKCKPLTYETGGHGFGIGRKQTDENAAWPDACMAWLREIGVIEPGDHK
ncbi:MAG: prolyl oligopeptidase family serine peptidase [Phycisphaera sp.]|nr:prolyl oligopeptidase family serine peptidase [Phycisphaera sp.]